MFINHNPILSWSYLILYSNTNKYLTQDLFLLLNQKIDDINNLCLIEVKFHTNISDYYKWVM